MDKNADILFKEAYESINTAEDIANIDMSEFISHCELVYKMNTSNFRKWFEDNNFEGNVEQQLWYQFTSKK